MIKEHKYVANDFCEDWVIWKYYTLEKFLWLLYKSEIYLCKASKFEDKNEFYVSERLAKYHRWSLQDCKKYIDIIKNRSYISCWHISEIESSNMWENYSDEKTGIAVKTTNKTKIVKLIYCTD